MRLVPQVRQAMLIRKHEEALDGQHSRQPYRSKEERYKRTRSSRSRSPVRRSTSSRYRSWSPDKARKPSFRSTTHNSGKLDQLPACPICLGRHKHHPASCRASETWNSNGAICKRTTNNRITNKQGSVICSDWQRPNRCVNNSGHHIHECSGCGSPEHGADTCPSAQP